MSHEILIISGNNQGVRTKLANELLNQGANLNVTIADLPEPFLKRLSKLFGPGFITRPKDFTGSYVSSAGAAAGTKTVNVCSHILEPFPI